MKKKKLIKRIAMLEKQLQKNKPDEMRKSVSGEIVKEITSKDVKKAAMAGVCPTCGERLFISGYSRPVSDGFFDRLFTPNHVYSVVSCPNGHNLDYSNRFIGKHDVKEYDLSKISCGFYIWTSNTELGKGMERWRNHYSD